MKVKLVGFGLPEMGGGAYLMTSDPFPGSPTGGIFDGGGEILPPTTGGALLLTNTDENQSNQEPLLVTNWLAG